MVQLQEKYPELIPNETNHDFIVETINLAIPQIQNMKKKSCKDCAREGRAQIAAETFLGAVIGGTFGSYGK